MRNDRLYRTVVGGLVLLMAVGVPRLAAAADVVLLSSNGMRPVLDEVLRTVGLQRAIEIELSPAA